MFQYPNQNDVLKKNIKVSEMEEHIGKNCLFLKNRGVRKFKGVIVDVLLGHYKVKTKTSTVFVSEENMYVIYEKILNCR